MTTPSFRVHHVAISVDHMDAAIAFYSLFGFGVALRYTDPDAAMEIAHLKLRDVFLEIWCFEDHAAAPASASQLASDLRRIGVKHLALQVPSVHEAQRLVEQHGIAVEVDVTRGRTGVTYFFVKDPSGNLLEILEDKREL
jgi:glyoxylase I family protein